MFLAGGTKDNAIPVSAKAVVAVTGADLDLSAITAELQNAFAGKEDGLTITLEKFGGSMSRVGVLSEDCQEKLLNLLTILPFGPAAMSTLPELVETSDNVGIIRTTEDMVEIATSVRSLIESEKQALIEKISTMAELCGATVSRNSEYPGWQYRMDSPLRDLAVSAYREQYGVK